MQVVAFDFTAKREWALAEQEKPACPEHGIFYWLVAAPEEQASLQAWLAALGVPPALASRLAGPQPEAHYEIYEEAIHCTIGEVRLDGTALRTNVLGLLLGTNFLAVVAPPVSPVLEKIRRLYREDFRQFARSSGFLLYELGSHLLEAYRRVFQHHVAEAERLQLRLFGDVTDGIFAEVADRTGDILAFHRTVLAARDLCNDLATRKSPFVPETTQPALDILSARLDRLGAEAAGIRGALNETLNLYMGMVSHRTNRIVTRLTVISMIFLPLSFLAGVYGMNFDFLPELRWRYSYLVFWAAVAVFMAAFVVFVRKKKWL